MRWLRGGCLVWLSWGLERFLGDEGEMWGLCWALRGLEMKRLTGFKSKFGV